MTVSTRIGYSLGPLMSMDDLIACAQLADYSNTTDSIWVPESWGRESFSTLGALSQVTTRARLGTSIINIFSRTPATVAMAATTLDMLSCSRTVIGLGASTETIVESWHGVKFEKPLARMREFVQCVKLMISGDRVNFDGKYYRVKNFKLLHTPVRKRIPVFVGAVNKGMLSVAGELADGVILYLRPLEEIEKTGRVIRKNTGGREFEIACSIICAISDQDPQKARERAAQTLAFYVAVGKYYRQFLSENGFRSEAAAIAETYSSDGIEQATRFVSERMLRSLAIFGTKEDCRKALAQFRSAGITLPIIQFNPVGSTEDSFRELLSTYND